MAMINAYNRKWNADWTRRIGIRGLSLMKNPSVVESFLSTKSAARSRSTRIGYHRQGARPCARTDCQVPIEQVEECLCVRLSTHAPSSYSSMDPEAPCSECGSRTSMGDELWPLWLQQTLRA